jgi:hypothetical protein
MDEKWEFVKSSWRNKPYVRRVPWCRSNPTLYQRRVRYFLGKTSHDSVGETGFVRYGSKDIPVVASRVKEGMSGRKFAPPRSPKAPEVLLKLIPTFEAVGQAVQSFKAWNRNIVPRLIQLQREAEKREKSILKPERRT